MSVETISPTRLEEIRKSGRTVELIDVRTPVEYRELHAEPARNFPLDQLDTHAIQNVRNGSADEPLYLICRSGSRAAKACRKFIDAGYANVVTIEGGTEAWEAAGLPVVRGKKAMSLERQVRIAAGSIVLAGVLLGWLVHPYLYGIAAFVGAGLVFAGITDTCGMGMLLARMPWNQVREERPEPPAATGEECESAESKATESCCT